MLNRTNRREFLQTTAAGIGFFVAAGVQAAESRSPNERIAMASIGIDGKGDSDSADAARHGDLVAICDVDDKKLDAAAKKYPKAKKFNDFRKMLETMGKSIDAVTVSTPDHTHAVAAAMAMKMGKHAFVQKPLTHTIYEARRLGEIAREMKVATQMGNQGTAESGLRRAAALLRKGILGRVTEVHVWTNRPIWPQGGPRPAPKPVPAELHWDEWLGPAPERPYGDGYHPFAWRGWWDFGTGALGDMACHTVNMPFMGLGLRDPVSVQARCSGHNKDSYPKWSVIEFEFPANDWRPGLKFVWYDGGELPPRELFGSEEDQKKLFTGRSGRKDKDTPKRSGCLVIGEKGKLYSPDDYAAEFRLSAGIEAPEVEFPESPGHFVEWVRAIKGGPQAMSNFPDYAGPLTETILLGNLAVWTADKAEKTADGSMVAVGKKIEWDAKNLVAKNAPEVAHIIKTEYRKGYSL
ncbi:MAG: Gfo/Idh/MocA family oxidoreductase [Thermoguttaceae bacterium]|jgi:predicted dehydrogenase|nr:Gfo/Idh/MocA family oxidoreductase [Thermoguttaceae bacterium]